MGGAVKDKLQSKNWGNLIIAVDPSLFGNASDFIDKVEVVSQRVKGAKKEDGVDEILLPGERGNKVAGKHASLLC